MGKIGPKFSHLLTVRAEGADPPLPPYGQPDRKNTVFFLDDFPNSDPLTFRNEELIQNCPRDQAYDACLTIIDRKGKKQELYLCLHLYNKYIHFKLVLGHLKIKSLN